MTGRDTTPSADGASPHTPTRVTAGAHWRFRRANELSAYFIRRRGAVLALSLIAIGIIALADLATGYEVALSLLYLGPVVAATWAFGLAAGLALSTLATAAWVATDFVLEHHYSVAAYRYWECFIRLATFSLFALIVDQLRRALARSDERLIAVLEGLDAAVCVIEPTTGAILYRNRAFDAQFPAGTQEAVSQRLLEAALAFGALPEAGEELRLLERWYLVGGRWIEWTHDRPVLLLSTTDVTARRDTEALAREQEAKLQATARLVAVGEIASTIAHELNQPLAAISNYLRGSLRRLRAGGGDAPAIAGALELAGEQAERAGQIIRRVRDFVHTRQPVLAELELNAVVARAARAAVPEDAAGPGVAMRLHTGLPPASADAVMIEQVVLNLVSNALEATREGGPSRTPVEVSTLRRGDDAIEVVVADRGPGLPANDEKRIFEPFFTSKPDGMGLGLNICRSIIEFHGGRLWAQPRDGGGAQFHFTVPVAGGRG